MDLFQQNIEIIKKNFPALYKKLNDFEPDLSNFLITEDIQGRQNLIANYSQGKVYLYSNYDMDREIKLWMDDLKDEQNICVLGFGLGYHIKELLKTEIKKMIIIEPDINLFLAALTIVDIRNFIDDRIIILIGNNYKEISSSIYHCNNEGMIDGIIFKALNSYRYIYMDWWNNLKEDFKGKATLFGNNIATKIVFAKDWLTNIVKNLDEYPKSALVKDYLDKFGGYPAVIVGAGPSLKKNMHLLNDIKDNALIFGVGSAVNILQKNNIKPHFMVGIDGSQEESEIFKRIHWNDVKFIYSPKLHYEGLNKYKGPKVYMKLDSDFISNWIEKKINLNTPYIESAATVSVIAGDVAKKMGCNPIIFIGQDLAYTDGSAYAEGAVHNEVMESEQWERIKIKDIYGNDVYTNKNWNSLRISFENYISNHEDILFIDATEGGARIKGTQINTFKETIEEYCKLIGINEKVNNIYEESFNKNNIDKNIIEDVKGYISKEIDNILDLTKDAINICIKMENDLAKGRNDNKVLKNNKKLDKFNKIIEKNEVYDKFIHPICDVFLFTIQDEIRRNLEKEDDILNKQRKLVKSSINQYKYIQEICEYALEVLKN
ncbi:motility associated factor glycosyltransferase family protein [Tepidibacter formicigenes]|uniref:Uncharacterized conserved protein n=1 Tax=Tepidibacter formicigenes DSM 15518 TaxID=1123349 RepID=A0A1M6P0D4_9FIRM|nr:6-hydroxymethylpterin diphosphokinase MptE-like protein [Tepidibacter formicigenes]SHK01381.1 Uncharacterized conserved protein [Tepidibacter formicigenes DSM 15518]